MTRKLKAAIVGSGNIGTDLMIKTCRSGGEEVRPEQAQAPRTESIANVNV